MDEDNGRMFPHLRRQEECSAEFNIVMAEADFFSRIGDGLLRTRLLECKLCLQITTANRAGDDLTIPLPLEDQTLAGLFNFKMQVWMLVLDIPQGHVQLISVRSTDRGASSLRILEEANGGRQLRPAVRRSSYPGAGQRCLCRNGVGRLPPDERCVRTATQA
ncbi:MAG: hypothetical protein ACREBC_02320 [Pyrinomonadaceae bacterium]